MDALARDRVLALAGIVTPRVEFRDQVIEDIEEFDDDEPDDEFDDEAESEGEDEEDLDDDPDEAVDEAETEVERSTDDGEFHLLPWYESRLGETRDFDDDTETRHRALALLGIPVIPLPPDNDNTIDDETRTILEALEEWVERQVDEDWEERGDVSKELRIPGGKGGGRWTANPVGKAISDALEAWGKGKGPDDPFTFDGKPIDREPLRKAAVARGITLKRGASRDDIVHALLGGARDEVKTQRAERQKRLGSAKFSINVGGKVDPEAARQVEVENKIRQAYQDLRRPDAAGTSWVGLADLRDKIGNDASRTEVDAALKRMAIDHGPGGADVVPESNQKALTPRDRAAVVHFGDQEKHAISIDDPSPRPMPTPVGGKKIDVAVYRADSKPDAPILREVSSANRPGRVITSQDDLAGLEKWATDNGHTDVAEWAKSERARAEAKAAPRTHQTDAGGRITEAEAWKRMHGDKPMPAKSAPKAPAKKAAAKAAKAAPKVDAHQIAADPSLTDRQKRSRLKSAGVAPEEVDRLVPTKAAAAKAAKAAPNADGLPSKSSAPTSAGRHGGAPTVEHVSPAVLGAPTTPAGRYDEVDARLRARGLELTDRNRKDELQKIRAEHESADFNAMTDAQLAARMDYYRRSRLQAHVARVQKEIDRRRVGGKQGDGLTAGMAPAGGARPKGEGGRPPAKPVAIHDLFNADDATVETALRDVFEGQFGPYTTKATVRIVRAGTRTDKKGKVHEVEPFVEVNGKIYDASGHEIGDFGRSIGPRDRYYPDGSVRREIWAEHHIVQLGNADEDRGKYQGKGFGGEFNRRAIEWYRASGVHGIAQKDHNGYVWASQGFDFAGGVMPDYKAQELRDLIAALRTGKATNKYNEPIPKQLRDAPNLDEQVAAAEELLARLSTTKPGEPGYPTAYEVSQLGRAAGQRGKTATWLGKFLGVSADQMILNPNEGEVVSP